MLQIPGNMTRKSKSNIHHKNVALFPNNVTSATKICSICHDFNIYQDKLKQ